MAQTPDALAREWFDQVWNKLDESAIDRLMAPDAIVYGLAPQPLHGPAQFKPYFHRLRAGLGGIRINVERTVVQGDMCAAHCHVVARHDGDSLGAPATNRDVDFTGITLLRVKDGLIVEGWNVFDFLTMYQQLGWVGNPVLPAAP